MEEREPAIFMIF